MRGVLQNSLFETQPHVFEHLNELSQQFAASYCGNSIIKDNIFSVIENYARKKEITLEILRFPIHDEELWAMTFLKKGTIFVCINSELALCKQFFAAAHELYHIYCYAEAADQSYIKNGSMLDSDTVNEMGQMQEDIEANAFAGLLLMPDQLLTSQIKLFGIDTDNMGIDSLLLLMDMFAIPYKAIILRLYENKCISQCRAEKLLNVTAEEVAKRIELTGKAKRWQLDGTGTESFGTLLEKMDYNTKYSYLTESREKEDWKYISELKNEFGMN